MGMHLTQETINAFTKHVLSEYPKEACGLVIDDEYVPQENIAEDPLTQFKIDPVNVFMAGSASPIQAVLHSHPYDKFNAPRFPAEWPTAADMDSWMNNFYPWGIVSTCGEGISPFVWLDDSATPPLEGREFVHGVTDCYALIRDWFQLERGIELPNFARGVEWWYAGKNLYDENFEAAGFVPISLEEATIGDCLMMKAASPVTNHAAVIVGPNKILHHLFHRLSGVDRMDKWKRCIVRAVRYKGK